MGILMGTGAFGVGEMLDQDTGARGPPDRGHQSGRVTDRNRP